MEIRNRNILERRPPEGFTDRFYESFVKSGKTTAQLERETGINHSDISRYMSGVMSPRVITFAILCKALNVSADYLLFGKEGV